MSDVAFSSDRHPGVILAGGLGRRMKRGDKPLLTVGGKTMLSRVIERLSPQVERIVLNANGDPARFSSYGLPVVTDPLPGFPGPLAGILAGMRWASAELPHASAIVTVAADTPFFPDDLMQRLARAQTHDNGTIALACSGAGVHPVFGLWPVLLADDLEQFLREGDSGKILRFVDLHSRIDVRFDDVILPNGEVIDPFFNVNTPEDAERAISIAAELERAAA
jgi:molybdopterin-guanine dinucleotide biosynthesis protein A